MTQVPILPIMPTYRKIGHHLWMCPKNTPKIVRIHLPCPPRVRNALMTSSDQFLHSVLWFWTSFDKFERIWSSLNTIWQVVKKAYLILCRWAYSSSSDKIKLTSLTRMDSVLTWLKIFLIPSSSSIIFNKFGNDEARPKKLIAHCFPDTWEHSISLEVGFFFYEFDYLTWGQKNFGLVWNVFG